MAGKNKEVFVKFEGDSRGLVSASKLSRKELDQISKAATNASGKLTGMNSRVGKVAKNIGLMGAAVGGVAAVGFAAAIKSTIDLADKYAKMSQKVNVSVESLSTLDHVAQLSGTNIDVLGKGLLRLGSNILDADRGLKESVENFEDLGVKTKTATGELRDADDVMLDVADRFANMEDGTQKSALAMKIFGKAGAELIPLLNNGADGIRAMTDEARALGIEISTDTAKQAEEFNDNLLRMGQLARGVAVDITTSLLPRLEEITSAFMDERLSGGGLLGAALKALGVGINGELGLAEKKLANARDRVVELREEMAKPTGFFGREKSKILADIEQAKVALLEAEKEVGSIISRRADGFSPDSLKPLGLSNDDNSSSSNNNKAADKAKKSLDSLNESLIKQVAVFGQSETEALRYRLTLGDLSDEVAVLGPRGQSLVESMLAQSAALGDLKQKQEASTKAMAQDAADKLKAIDIIHGLKTEEELLAEAIANVNLLVESGFLTDGQGFERAKQLIDEFDQIKNKTNETEDSFKDLTTAVNGWGAEFADTMLSAEGSFKGFAESIIKQMAKIAIQQLSQPLLSSFGGFLSSAIGGSFGGGSVALPAGGGAIHLSSYDGGGFTGSGSRSGGVDGKGGFPAILHPNETVLDHTKKSTSQASDSSGVTQHITIDARGAQPGMEQKIRAAAEEGARKGYMMVLDDVRRNGAIRGALG